MVATQYNERIDDEDLEPAPSHLHSSSPNLLGKRLSRKRAERSLWNDFRNYDTIQLDYCILIHESYGG